MSDAVNDFRLCLDLVECNTVALTTAEDSNYVHSLRIHLSVQSRPTRVFPAKRTVPQLCTGNLSDTAASNFLLPDRTRVLATRAVYVAQLTCQQTQPLQGKGSYMKSWVLAFLREEEGLTTVEYAIAGGLVGAGVIAAFMNLGEQVFRVINEIFLAVSNIVVN